MCSSTWCLRSLAPSPVHSSPRGLSGPLHLWSTTFGSGLVQLGCPGNQVLLRLAKGLEVALVAGELEKVEAPGGCGLPHGLILLVNPDTAVGPDVSSLGIGTQYHGPFFLQPASLGLSSVVLLFIPNQTFARETWSGLGRWVMRENRWTPVIHDLLPVACGLFTL